MICITLSLNLLFFTLLYSTLFYLTSLHFTSLHNTIFEGMLSLQQMVLRRESRH